MQSIISRNGFGFCKTSSFRNCNNCAYRLRCISCAPNYMLGLTQGIETKSLNLQNTRTIEQNIENDTKLLIEENAYLKEKIQELETQILLSNQKTNNQTETNKVVNQETQHSGLQVYNNNLAISQQEEPLLKQKRGLFGTKFVEDVAKKK